MPKKPQETSTNKMQIVSTNFYYIFTHKYIHIHAHTQIYASTHIHARTHARSHAHAQTHTRTHANSSEWRDAMAAEVKSLIKNNTWRSC